MRGRRKNANATLLSIAFSYSASHNSSNESADLHPLDSPSSITYMRNVISILSSSYIFLSTQRRLHKIRKHLIKPWLVYSNGDQAWDCTPNLLGLYYQEQAILEDK